MMDMAERRTQERATGRNRDGMILRSRDNGRKRGTRNGCENDEGSIRRRGRRKQECAEERLEEGEDGNSTLYACSVIGKQAGE